MDSESNLSDSAISEQQIDSDEAPLLREVDHGNPTINTGATLSVLIGQHLDKRSTWALCIILAAMGYLHSLVESTFVWYGFFETPWHSEILSRIQLGNLAMRVSGILFFSRLADMYSRHASSAAALLLFTLGSIIAGAAPNLATFATGMIIHAIGSAGLGLLITLFIADYTSLKWRGLALSWVYFSHFINMWVASCIRQNVNWRWAYGMFAILVTAICVPALVLLFSAAARFQATPHRASESWAENIKHCLVRMDLIGLIVFISGCGLIQYGLVFWNIAQPIRNVMLAMGLILLLLAFFLWEFLYAPFPLMPKGILTNRAVTCGILVTFLSRLSYTIQLLGLAVLVIPISRRPMLFGYYLASSPIAYNVFAPIVGVAFLITRRYKPHILVGNVISMLGCGLLIHCARIVHPPLSVPQPLLIFATQILIGIGRVATELGLTVGAQASVSHNDMAIAIGLISTWPLLGNSLGGLVGEQILSHMDASQPATFIIIFTLALILLLLSFALSLLMPNYVLGATHNAVEEAGTEEGASRVNEAGLNA